jgi:hypothetical protein
VESSFIIVVGGVEYPVPRNITAEGGVAAEVWVAGELLASVPDQSLGSMNRAALEAEAFRLGLSTALPEGVTPDDASLALLVQSCEAGKPLTNADFVAAITARREALAAIIPPPTPVGGFDIITEDIPVLAEGDPE